MRMKTSTFGLFALMAALASSPAYSAVDDHAKVAEIDKLVAADLAKNKLQPNTTASDEVFVRRIFLDVIGRVPTKKETVDFLNSQDAGKRAKLIDQLLAGDGYTQNFFNFWADVLRLQSSPVGGSQSSASGYAYARWLKDALKANKPYDVMVREMVTARGSSYENGATGFYIRDYNMPLDNMAVTTQIFLGTSMVCAQCHDHPFDKWSQLDYYKMAAHTYGMEGTNGLVGDRSFYKAVGANGVYGMTGKGKAKAKAKGKKAAQPEVNPYAGQIKGYETRDLTRALTEILRPLRYNHVVSNERKDLKLPGDYKYDNAKPRQAIEPTIPVSFSKDGTVAKKGEGPELGYADWMTSRDNPRFTLVIANRLWRKVMGVGLIEPVDEITDSTVPSNPALMTMLEGLMKDLNYDMKAFLRIVLNSRTYQSEAYAKDLELGEQYHFQGPLVRRMSAEQIWDSMVGLFKPNPDAPSRLHEIDRESTIRRIEWLDRAIQALSTEELIEGTKKIADLQKQLAQDVRKAQEQLTEANKSKNEAAIREAKQVVSQQRRKIDEAAEEIVYTMGWKKFAELAREGKLKEQIHDPEFAAEISAVLKSKKGGDDLTIDEAIAIYNKMQRTKFNQSRAQADKAMAERLKVETKEQEAAFDAWKVQRDSYVVRAADIKSPSPNGHFLREFGQSDRELVENASDDATVGQSLMMLNGKYFRNLMTPFTMISRALAPAATSDEAIDTIYLSLLSRRATEDEKALLRPVLANPKSQQQRGDVLWALINTRQFLFIE